MDCGCLLDRGRVAWLVGRKACSPAQCRFHLRLRHEGNLKVHVLRKVAEQVARRTGAGPARLCLPRRRLPCSCVLLRRARPPPDWADRAAAAASRRCPPAAAGSAPGVQAQRGVLLEHCQEPARGPVVRWVQVEVGEPRARPAAAAIAVVCGDGRLHSRTRTARRVSTSGRRPGKSVVTKTGRRLVAWCCWIESAGGKVHCWK